MDSVALERLNRAIDLAGAGETLQAETVFEAVLSDDPANPIANHFMGIQAFGQGDLETAETRFTIAVASAPWEAEYYNDLGVVLNARGNPPAACLALQGAVGLKPDFTQALNNLGAAFEAAGDDVSALESYRRALDIDPGYVDARDNLDQLCARSAPAWHFPMMADAPRNQAYDAAIRRAVPGRRVLDIGTGSGLLAMMAARAGASAVTTCETMVPIAQAAERIIAANGLDGRIKLVPKHSDKMQVGPDLDDRAEVLVTETFASGVLSEAVLTTLEHARRHLLTPDAAIIPSAAWARGYLAGGEAIEAHMFAPTFTGFDLSGFDVFAPSKVGMHLDRIPHEVFSDDFEIFAFDLMQLNFPAERRLLSVTATRAGRCMGVAQWLKLELDPESTYENRPHADAGANGWMHVLYRFSRPLDLQPGDEVRLIASHNRKAMTVALAQ